MRLGLPRVPVTLHLELGASVETDLEPDLLSAYTFVFEVNQPHSHPTDVVAVRVTVDFAFAASTTGWATPA